MPSILVVCVSARFQIHHLRSSNTAQYRKKREGVVFPMNSAMRIMYPAALQLTVGLCQDDGGRKRKQ